jgi:solute carrier family 25 carnitine/acylcarnitine transporter 20/29
MSNLLYDCGYYFGGGVLAGVVGTMVSQPFDSCKIYLQSQQRLELNQRKSLKYSLASRTIKNNVKWAYRGMTPSIIGYGVEKSLVFGTYSTVCNIFMLDEHKISHTFGAGLIAGLVASLSITPAEQIKIDQQINAKTKYSIKYLYRGLKYTAMREGNGFSIYFSVYNQLSKYFNCNDKDSFNIKIAKSGILGACSAFIAWIPIYPIDVNKTLIQSGDSCNKFLSNLTQTNGINKIKILYSGYGYGMMRAIPFHATCFMVFESLKYYKK